MPTAHHAPNGPGRCDKRGQAGSPLVGVGGGPCRPLGSVAHGFRPWAGRWPQLPGLAGLTEARCSKSPCFSPGGQHRQRPQDARSVMRLPPRHAVHCLAAALDCPNPIAASPSVAGPSPAAPRRRPATPPDGGSRGQIPGRSAVVPPRGDAQPWVSLPDASSGRLPGGTGRRQVGFGGGRASTLIPRASPGSPSPMHPSRRKKRQGLGAQG